MRFPNLSVCNPQRPLVSHPALEMGHHGFLHLTHTKQIQQPKAGRGPLTPRVLTNGASHQIWRQHGRASTRTARTDQGSA